MDEILDHQTQPDNPISATPFSVDLFSPSGENFFEEYTKKIAPVSVPIKNILMDSSTTDFVENLGQAFILSLEQKNDVLRIIRDILLGDLSAGDMTVTIAKKLTISQQTAQQIRDKIVKELFAPAIEDIKKIQREKFPDRVGQGSVNTTRPTMSQPPAPPQMKNGPPINQSNVIDLRNNP